MIERRRQRAAGRIVEAVEGHNDEREQDWILINSGELAGRHQRANAKVPDPRQAIKDARKPSSYRVTFSSQTGFG